MPRRSAINQASFQCFTAFLGERRLASGPLAEVAIAVLKASKTTAAQPIIIFDDAIGRPIDLDLRGTERDVVARLPQPTPDSQAATDEVPAPEPRGRGRPKLGVVAREVTLLPRHWEWLATQQGGASVALRKLVERRAGPTATAIAAAPRKTPPIVSCRPWPATADYEEASRALFADDRRSLPRASPTGLAISAIISSRATSLSARRCRLIPPT